MQITYLASTLPLWSIYSSDFLISSFHYVSLTKQNLIIFPSKLTQDPYCWCPGFWGLPWFQEPQYCLCEMITHEKKIGHRDCSPSAHGELTVTKMVTASHHWAVIELWPGRDWAVIILKMPWLNCDLAVTELWPRRDWAVTSPSRDWAVIIGPGAVTTVVTVSSLWQFFSHEYALVFL